MSSKTQIVPRYEAIYEWLEPEYNLEVIEEILPLLAELNDSKLLQRQRADVMVLLRPSRQGAQIMVLKALGVRKDAKRKIARLRRHDKRS